MCISAGNRQHEGFSVVLYRSAPVLAHEVISLADARYEHLADNNARLGQFFCMGGSIEIRIYIRRSSASIEKKRKHEKR